MSVTPIEPVLDADNVRVAVTGAIYGGPTTAAKPTSASSVTTGYTGYFWVDTDIRKEVIDAQRGGKAYAPRNFRDETNRKEK